MQENNASKQAEQGTRLRAVRLALNLTQEQLAKRLGYKSFSSIANLEAGDTKVSIDVIGYLSTVHQVNPDYIIEGDGLMFKPTAATGGIHHLIQALVDCYERLSSPQQGFVEVSLEQLLAQFGCKKNQKS